MAARDGSMISSCPVHRRSVAANGPLSPGYYTRTEYCDWLGLYIWTSGSRIRSGRSRRVTTRWRGEPMSSEEQVPATEELIDNLDRGRFELYHDGDLVGWLYYTYLKPNRYALQHTQVEASHQHQGVADAMVRRVLDEIRA